MTADRLRKLQAALTAMITQAELLNTDETKKEVSADLRKQYPEDHGYQSPYPSLFGRLHAEVLRVSYEVKSLTQAVVDLELMERLQTVMERLEVYANIDHGYNGRPDQDNTRELRLLELLTTSDEYSYERRQLQEKLAKTLNEVEEAEWEKEHDSAVETLEGAGFERVEDDILDGWRRIVDGVVEEVVIEMHRPGRRLDEQFGYKFEYEKKLATGAVLLNGTSGQFAKLLEVAGIVAPVAA